MAVKPTSTAHAEFNELLKDRERLIHTLENIQNPRHKRHPERALAEVEEMLLDLPAPNHEAVVTKLDLLWAAELHGQDQESRQKLLVLHDLRRLIAA